MPRRPRKLLHEGRFFHITARGVAGSMIFADDFDRRRFVLYLEDVSEYWGWRVVSWCLMGTHYHLVVEATQEQMSLAVHRLHCLYAMYFNRRHERRGHLFENRFSATLIRNDSHFAQTLAYIEHNPVRAGLCVEPADWLWTWPRPAREVRPAA
jgi:REP element-mobilizing transposase RayT